MAKNKVIHPVAKRLKENLEEDKAQSGKPKGASTGTDARAVAIGPKE